MIQIQFDTDEVAMQSNAGDGGCSAAKEWVEDEVAGVCRGEDAAFDQGNGFLGWVFAECFFFISGSAHCPHAFHLFAGDGFHGTVVENVFGFFVFGGPQNCFGGVGEVAAA